MNKIEPVLSSKTTMKDIPSLLGSIVPWFETVFTERLSYKNIELDKILALKQSKGDFKTKWALCPKTVSKN